MTPRGRPRRSTARGIALALAALSASAWAIEARGGGAARPARPLLRTRVGASADTFAVDGVLFATMNRRRFQVYSASTGERRWARTAHTDLSQILFSPDGRTLVSLTSVEGRQH